MSTDSASFPDLCIHCLGNDSHYRIPSLLGHAINGVNRNEIIQFYYCYIGLVARGNIHIAILIDDLSGYNGTYLCEASQVERTVSMLWDWFAALRICFKSSSDQGSHFKNKLVHMIPEKMHCAHLFTLP